MVIGVDYAHNGSVGQSKQLSIHLGLAGLFRVTFHIFCCLPSWLSKRKTAVQLHTPGTDRIVCLFVVVCLFGCQKGKKLLKLGETR